MDEQFAQKSIFDVLGQEKDLCTKNLFHNIILSFDLK